MDTNTLDLQELTADEAISVNGGDSAFWNDFWDGVLADLQSVGRGFNDGFHR